MGKTWVLDTDTKGTGARMVPLDKVVEERSAPQPAPRRKPDASAPPAKPTPRKPKAPVRRSASPLGRNQVRKKSTGEIGTVKAVDARAGTATVHWLRQGRTSTVPLTEISRR